MDIGPSWTNFFVIIFLLVLATLFTLTEYSLVRVRMSALHDIQEKNPHSKKIKAAINMVENLTEYLSTAQVGITLTSLLLGWLGEGFIAGLIINAHLLPKEYVDGVASAVAILLFTVVHAVFTDLVPKNIAIEKPLKVLLAITHAIRFFYITLFPLIWVMDRLSMMITRALGFSVGEEEDAYSQTEILSLSKHAEENGELEPEDLTFMQRAFDMNDKVAVDIMIDRTSMVVIDVQDSINDALNLYLSDRYSRFPVVAGGNKDKVLGYIYSYDIIRQSRIDGTQQVSQIMRDIPAVPENMEVHDVYRAMMRTRSPMVIVVDEYGGTSGIVTDKDIYEELFGTLRDEIDDVSDDYIEKLGSDKYKVQGKITLYDFERYFDIRLKEFDEDEAVTLTGYVINHYPEFRKHDTITIDCFQIQALDYENAYINEFEVTKLEINKDEKENS